MGPGSELRSAVDGEDGLFSQEGHSALDGSVGRVKILEAVLAKILCDHLPMLLVQFLAQPLAPRQADGADNRLRVGHSVHLLDSLLAALFLRLLLVAQRDFLVRARRRCGRWDLPHVLLKLAHVEVQLGRAGLALQRQT